MQLRVKAFTRMARSKFVQERLWVVYDVFTERFGIPLNASLFQGSEERQVDVETGMKD